MEIPEIWPKHFELQPAVIDGQPFFILRFIDEAPARAVEVGLTPATLVALHDEMRMRTDQILGIA